MSPTTAGSEPKPPPRSWTLGKAAPGNPRPQSIRSATLGEDTETQPRRSKRPGGRRSLRRQQRGDAVGCLPQRGEQPAGQPRHRDKDTHTRNLAARQSKDTRRAADTVDRPAIVHGERRIRAQHLRPRRARRRRFTRLPAIRQPLPTPKHLQKDRRARGHRDQVHVSGRRRDEINQRPLRDSAQSFQRRHMLAKVQQARAEPVIRANPLHRPTGDTQSCAAARTPQSTPPGAPGPAPARSPTTRTQTRSLPARPRPVPSPSHLAPPTYPSGKPTPRRPLNGQSMAPLSDPFLASSITDPNVSRKTNDYHHAIVPSTSRGPRLSGHRHPAPTYHHIWS
jgi:hypothetical protein